jgi:glycosyltransferase involved in cell wall biosynthesis
MKIVFSNYDSPGNPWYDGGGARAVQAVASRLAQRHSVRYVSGAFPGAPAGSIDGVVMSRVGFGGAGPKPGQLIFQLLLPWQVRRFDFDVWVESLTPPFSTACLQRFTRKPVVALTQVLAGRGMTEKYRLPFHAFERWGLRHYRHFIATSGHLRDELLALNPQGRIAVIPNGVEGTLVRDGRHDRDHHVLFLGRLDIAQKGIDLLLEAVAKSPPPPLPLVLAGAGVPADEDWIRRRIRELGIQDRVHLPGRVDGAERLRLFREAACLVLPSRFEASPLVLAEAFCFALPVVMFDIPELKGLPATCCLKVAPFDTTAFGAALGRLLSDAESRRVMGAAAKQEARHYDWDDLALRYEVFLQSVTAS